MMASSGNARRRPKQCRFFLQGYCRYGNWCWNSHGQSDFNSNIVNENKSVNVPAVTDDGDVGEESGANCGICLESCFTAGSHRLASLKCGHTFGHSCITQWLSSQGHGGKCPHCNSSASLQDIIVIYTTLQKTVDRDTLEKLEKEREMKRKLEEDKAEIHEKYEREVSQISKLLQEFERLQRREEERKKRDKEWAELCQEKDKQVALLEEKINNILLKVEIDKKSKQNIEKVVEPKQEFRGIGQVKPTKLNTFVNSKSHSDNLMKSKLSNEPEDLFNTCTSIAQGKTSKMPSSSQMAIDCMQVKKCRQIEPAQPCLGDNSGMTLSLQSSIDVSENGGCRVMAYSDKLGMLAVSVPNTDVKKPGFTIKSINIKNMKMYLSVPKPGFTIKSINVKNIKMPLPVPFHEKQIRDIAFSPINNEILLSVGLDGKIELTDMEHSSTIQTFNADSPLWSCCWSTHNAAQIFAGTASGCIIEFNITSGPMRTFRVEGSGPVVSLCYVPESPSHLFSSGGLIVGRIESCNFILIPKDSVKSYKDYTFPFEGPFTCVSFEPITRYMLVSCRPSQNYPEARHLVCELMDCNLHNGTTEIWLKTIKEFKGGSKQKVMSRSYLAPSPLGSETVLACANDEVNLSTSIWDFASGSTVGIWNDETNVVDILHFSNSGNSYIGLLTENDVKLYKWVDLRRVIGACKK